MLMRRTEGGRWRPNRGIHPDCQATHAITRPTPTPVAAASLRMVAIVSTRLEAAPKHIRSARPRSSQRPSLTAHNFFDPPRQHPQPTQGAGSSSHFYNRLRLYFLETRALRI